MSVTPTSLRNAADYIQKTSGVNPTWLREAADEIARLNEVIAAHIDHANKLHGQVERANALLRWGTWDMTPAAIDDWKKRAEAHLTDEIGKSELDTTEMNPAFSIG